MEIEVTRTQEVTTIVTYRVEVADDTDLSNLKAALTPLDEYILDSEIISSAESLCSPEYRLERVVSSKEAAAADLLAQFEALTKEAS